VILDPGSPSSCVFIRVEPGFVPCSFLQEKGVGAVPQCAGGGEFEPGYRVDAPHAEHENADTGACPAGTPQRRAATRTSSLLCASPAGAKHSSRAPASRSAAAGSA
jgi:hypothetical protein